MLVRYIVCFIFAISFLDADEPPQITHTPSEVHDNAIPSLINLTGMPSCIVNGSVNVITGELCEYGHDAIVTGGPNPYTLGHSYCSTSLEEGNLGDGWNFLHHHLLEVFQPARISYVRKSLDSTPYLYPIEATQLYKSIMGEPSIFSEIESECSYNSFCTSERVIPHAMQRMHGGLVEKGHSDDTEPLFLSIFEPSGGRLLFKTDFDEEHKERSMRHFRLVTKNSGFTNITHGNMSGQTNIKNITVRWSKKEDRFYVTLGDGTRRVYERQSKHAHGSRAEYYRDYQLHKEEHPNGNITYYDYKNHEIIKIATYNKDLSKQLNWISFEQKTAKAFAKHPSLHIKTSDGQEHVYYFTHLDGSLVNYTNRKGCDIGVSDGSHMHGTYSISNIVRQGMPVLSYSYSKKQHHHKIRLKSKTSSDGSYIKTKYHHKKGDKFIHNRVKIQLAPVGPNGKEIVTHRYDYYKDKGGGGHTSVRDAYHNVTRYYWNKDKRLIRIAKYDAHNTLLMQEEFIWAENSSYNEGRLRAHVVRDEHKKVRLAKKYNYDSRGNVLEEILLARVTQNTGDIEFNQDLTHNETCDDIVTRYTYSDDGFNLKLSECDPLGNYTYYEYHPHTNLLKAKFICDKKAIKKREFFIYNDAACLVKHIVDDGNTKEQDNLQGATERHIKRIIPKPTAPHFGEPLQVDEFYWDFTTNERVWYKREINHYNDKGLVVKKEQMDRLGSTLANEYSYDEAGRLLETKNPLGHITKHCYDPITKRLIKTITANNEHTFNYDAMGRVVQETNALDLTTTYEYDLLGRKEAMLDAQGNRTSYQYDALDRLIKITYPDTYDHKGQIIPASKTYSYIGLGTYVIEKDELDQTTKTTHNALRLVTDKVLPDGSGQHYKYDLKGRLVEETAPNGTKTCFTYDAFDRIVCKKILQGSQELASSQAVYNTFHPIQEISPLGESITYHYDSSGKLIERLEGDRRTTYSYDAKMRLKKETTHLANNGFITKQLTYDELDRVVAEKLYDHTQEARTLTQYGYDEEHNQTEVLRVINGQPAKTCNSYLPYGLLQKQTDAQGHTTHHHYNYHHINPYGQSVLQKITTDARGCTHEEVYNTRGKLASALSYDPLHNPIAKKELFYDAAGNLVRTHEYTLTTGSTNQITTLYEYSNNHLISVVEAHNTPEEKSTHYLYNMHGQLHATITSDKTVINQNYDALGRLQHYSSSDYSIDYSYCYDANSNILEVLNNISGNKTTRSYNNYGELASETLETGITLEYSYDLAGRVNELTLPDNSKVLYSHSTFLDKMSRLSPAGKELYSHTILNRDLSGFSQSVQLAHNAGILSTSRDCLGRITSINHPHFTETVPEEGFDPVGNLLHLTTNNTSRELSYDWLSQLIAEPEHSYQYDALYNRLKKDDTTYAVNSLHAVTAINDRSITYDKRGNRIEDSQATYRYDALNRLIEAQTKTGSYHYSYDAFNRRLSKQTDGTTEYYLWAQENEIGALDESKNITELRILAEGLGAEIGASIALELYGTTYIPLHDRQGSITALLNTNGTPVERYSYDAFGIEITPENPTSPWRFSSKRVDAETGFVYFGERYYDPNLGKWLTQDPLGLSAGPNLYAYVNNCPMTRFDAHGLLAELESGQCERVYSRNGNHVVLEHSYTLYGFERDQTRDVSSKKPRSTIKSKFIDAGTKEIPGIYILGINGIFNSELSAQGNLNYLSSLGDNVKLQGLWNATNGPLDLPEAFMQTKLGFYSPPSRMLKNKLIDINSKDPKAVVLLCSFSQGATVVKGALELSQPHIRQSVMSIAFGPAEVIPKKLCSQSDNYISKNDLVTYFGDLTGILSNKDCVHFINPHQNAPHFPFDHSFQSPTYHNILKDSLETYIKNNRRDGQ